MNIKCWYQLYSESLCVYSENTGVMKAINRNTVVFSRSESVYGPNDPEFQFLEEGHGMQRLLAIEWESKEIKERININLNYIVGILCMLLYFEYFVCELYDYIDAADSPRA